MGNANACKPFGYSIDEGMKVFSIVEMFMGIYHIVILTTVYHWIHEMIRISRAGCKLSVVHIMMFIFLLILLVSLILQIIFGILLHVLGYRKRNVTICLIWVIIACVSFTCPWLVLLFQYLQANNYCTYPPWTTCFLYLLYLILGVWIVVAYMKWSRAAGVAVEFSVTPAPAPNQEKHKKTRTDDDDV